MNNRLELNIAEQQRKYQNITSASSTAVGQTLHYSHCGALPKEVDQSKTLQSQLIPIFFIENGCDVKMKQEQIIDHEKNCLERTFTCPRVNCKEVQMRKFIYTRETLLGRPVLTTLVGDRTLEEPGHVILLLLVHPSELVSEGLVSNTSNHKLIICNQTNIGPFLSGPRPFGEEQTMQDEGSPEHVKSQEEEKESTDPSHIGRKLQSKGVKIGIFNLNPK